jgi:hypothetical protein
MSTLRYTFSFLRQWKGAPAEILVVEEREGIRNQLGQEYLVYAQEQSGLYIGNGPHLVDRSPLRR